MLRLRCQCFSICKQRRLRIRLLCLHHLTLIRLLHSFSHHCVSPSSLLITDCGTSKSINSFVCSELECNSSIKQCKICPNLSCERDLSSTSKCAECDCQCAKYCEPRSSKREQHRKRRPRYFLHSLSLAYQNSKLTQANSNSNFRNSPSSSLCFKYQYASCLQNSTLNG